MFEQLLAERGLDLKDQQQFEAALAEVDRVHDRIAGEFGIGAENTIVDQTTDTERSQTQEQAKEQAEHDRAREAAEAEAEAMRVVTSRTQAAKADLARLAAPVNDADARRYVAAVEDRLTPDELARLRRGDVTVLEGVGTREDQLSVAREYLKADGHSPEALRQVTRELHQEREVAHRESGHDEGLDHA